jgi:hypothetical protein
MQSSRTKDTRHYSLLLSLLLLSHKQFASSTPFSATQRLPFVSFVTTIVGENKDRHIVINSNSNNKSNNNPSILFSRSSAPEISIDSIRNNNNNISNNTDGKMTTNDNEGIASKLARPNILELQPYRCARDDYSDGVLLDANENAFGPTSLPTKSLDPYDNSNNLERYPDPYQGQLKELFCRERGNDLQPSNVFVGVGSDEAIDLLMRIFCTPGVGRGGDNILITPPTYGMYKVCAKVNDVEVVSAPLTPDFDLDIPKVRCVGKLIKLFGVRNRIFCFALLLLLQSRSLDDSCCKTLTSQFYEN